MRWIESASTVVEMVIRVLLLVILMVVGTVLVVGFLRLGRADSKSITIASFTESTADTREDKSRGLGHDLADSLEFEILRIAQLHTLTNPWGSPQELPALQMTGAQTVERVGGTISLAGVELPVEVVVEVLKPLLARPRTQYVITGKFQRLTSNEGTRMNASGKTAEKDDCLMVPMGDGTPVQLIVRLEADGRMRKRWTCLSLLTSAADRDADMPSPLGLHLARHLRKIAYEITWIVLEGVEANSFENFKAFIEGVETFRKYKDLVRLSSTTKDEGKKLSGQEELKMQEVFDKAEALLKQAIAKESSLCKSPLLLGKSL